MKKLVAFCLILLLLCGCTPMQNTATSKPVVVVGITVTRQTGTVTTRRHYTSSSKMRSVLDYLRWVKPYGTTNGNPLSDTGESYRIILSYSDGSEKWYQQIANQYFLEEGKSWQLLDPEKAGVLGQIFAQMESD